MQSGQPSTEVVSRSGSGLRTLLRLCAGIACAALIIYGGVLLRAGFLFRAECRVAEVAEVLNTSVDLGAPGVHHATLKQTAAFTCRQYIRLVSELREGESAQALLRGLELTLAVKDTGGVEQMAGVFPLPFATDDHTDSVTIADQRPLPIGEYSVVIEVVKAAPALAGRPVQIVSGYSLCGIEWMGATVWITGGTVCATIGLLVCGVLWVTRRSPPRRISAPDRDVSRADSPSVHEQAS